MFALERPKFKASNAKVALVLVVVLACVFANPRSFGTLVLLPGRMLITEMMRFTIVSPKNSEFLS